MWNEVAVWVTSIAACSAVGLSLLTVYRLKEIHKELNSRLTMLLKAAYAQGVVQERADQDARDVVMRKSVAETTCQARSTQQN